MRTVKGDPDIVLKAANELHPNLQFTIENPDSNGDLAFLDLNINVDSRKKVTCGWYHVGQTVRHLTTRIEEHHKENSPVGQRLRECDRDGKSAELKSEIIDQSSNIQKLLTLEALHIWKERPRINRREEFRSRELTLKL